MTELSAWASPYPVGCLFGFKGRFMSRISAGPGWIEVTPKTRQASKRRFLTPDVLVKVSVCGCSSSSCDCLQYVQLQPAQHDPEWKFLKFGMRGNAEARELHDMLRRACREETKEGESSEMQNDVNDNVTSTVAQMKGSTGGERRGRSSFRPLDMGESSVVARSPLIDVGTASDSERSASVSIDPLNLSASSVFNQHSSSSSVSGASAAAAADAADAADDDVPKWPGSVTPLHIHLNSQSNPTLSNVRRSVRTRSNMRSPQQSTSAADNASPTRASPLSSTSVVDDFAAPPPNTMTPPDSAMGSEPSTPAPYLSPLLAQTIMQTLAMAKVQQQQQNATLNPLAAAAYAAGPSSSSSFPFNPIPTPIHDNLVTALGGNPCSPDHSHLAITTRHLLQKQYVRNLQLTDVAFRQSPRALPLMDSSFGEKQPLQPQQQFMQPQQSMQQFMQPQQPMQQFIQPIKQPQLAIGAPLGGSPSPSPLPVALIGALPITQTDRQEFRDFKDFCAKFDDMAEGVLDKPAEMRRRTMEHVRNSMQLSASQ